jgi:hypothetical protein
MVWNNGSRKRSRSYGSDGGSMNGGRGRIQGRRIRKGNIASTKIVLLNSQPLAGVLMRQPFDVAVRHGSRRWLEGGLLDPRMRVLLTVRHG